MSNFKYKLVDVTFLPIRFWTLVFLYASKPYPVDTFKNGLPCLLFSRLITF